MSGGLKRNPQSHVLKVKWQWSGHSLRYTTIWSVFSLGLLSVPLPELWLSPASFLFTALLQSLRLATFGWICALGQGLTQGKTHWFCISCLDFMFKGSSALSISSIPIHHVMKQPSIHLSYIRQAVFSSLRDISTFIYIYPRHYSQETQDETTNEPLLWPLQKFGNNLKHFLPLAHLFCHRRALPLHECLLFILCIIYIFSILIFTEAFYHLLVLSKNSLSFQISIH